MFITEKYVVEQIKAGLDDIYSKLTEEHSAGLTMQYFLREIANNIKSIVDKPEEMTRGAIDKRVYELLDHKDYYTGYSNDIIKELSIINVLSDDVAPTKKLKELVKKHVRELQSIFVGFYNKKCVDLGVG